MIKIILSTSPDVSSASPFPDSYYGLFCVLRATGYLLCLLMVISIFKYSRIPHIQPQHNQLLGITDSVNRDFYPPKSNLISVPILEIMRNRLIYIYNKHFFECRITLKRFYCTALLESVLSYRTILSKVCNYQVSTFHWTRIFRANCYKACPTKVLKNTCYYCM